MTWAPKNSKELKCAPLADQGMLSGNMKPERSSNVPTSRDLEGWTGMGSKLTPMGQTNSIWQCWAQLAHVVHSVTKWGKFHSAALGLIPCLSTGHWHWGNRVVMEFIWCSQPWLLVWKASVWLRAPKSCHFLPDLFACSGAPCAATSNASVDEESGLEVEHVLVIGTHNMFWSPKEAQTFVCWNSCFGRNLFICSWIFVPWLSWVEREFGMLCIWLTDTSRHALHDQQKGFESFDAWSKAVAADPSLKFCPQRRRFLMFAKRLGRQTNDPISNFIANDPAVDIINMFVSSQQRSDRRRNEIFRRRWLLNDSWSHFSHFLYNYCRRKCFCQVLCSSSCYVRAITFTIYSFSLLLANETVTVLL